MVRDVAVPFGKSSINSYYRLSDIEHDEYETYLDSKGTLENVDYDKLIKTLIVGR